MPTVSEIFGQMPASFVPEAAKDLVAAIQFDITGEGGGVWLVRIDDGTLHIVEERIPTPDLTITATAEDYVKISTGQLNEQLAFMTGRISARGNTRLAMKLPRIFKR